MSGDMHHAHCFTASKPPERFVLITGGIANEIWSHVKSDEARKNYAHSNSPFKDL